MQELVRKTLDEHQQVVSAMAALEDTIVRAGQLCAAALAAELIGRFVADRRSLPAVALTTDSSALTAIGNDYGYDQVFNRQVEGLCREGDVLIAISTSGNSKNILNAVDTAQALKTKVIGFTGKTGGRLHSACDLSLVVPSDVTARIQEMHIVMGHLLCALIEDELGLDAG